MHVSGTLFCDRYVGIAIQKPRKRDIFKYRASTASLRTTLIEVQYRNNTHYKHDQTELVLTKYGLELYVAPRSVAGLVYCVISCSWFRLTCVDHGPLAQLCSDSATRRRQSPSPVCPASSVDHLSSQPSNFGWFWHTLFCHGRVIIVGNAYELIVVHPRVHASYHTSSLPRRPKRAYQLPVLQYLPLSTYFLSPPPVTRRMIAAISLYYGGQANIPRSKQRRYCVSAGCGMAHNKLVANQ